MSTAISLNSPTSRKGRQHLRRITMDRKYATLPREKNREVWCEKALDLSLSLSRWILDYNINHNRKLRVRNYLKFRNQSVFVSPKSINLGLASETILWMLFLQCSEPVPPNLCNIQGQNEETKSQTKTETQSVLLITVLNDVWATAVSARIMGNVVLGCVRMSTLASKAKSIIKIAKLW